MLYGSILSDAGGGYKKRVVLCFVWMRGNAGKGDWHARLRQFQNAKKP